MTPQAVGAVVIPSEVSTLSVLQKYKAMICHIHYIDSKCMEDLMSYLDSTCLAAICRLVIDR